MHGLRVASLAGVVLQAAQTFALDIDRRANDRQVAATLVESVIVDPLAPCWLYSRFWLSHIRVSTNSIGTSSHMV